jgi:hypothetical protein
VQVFYIFFGLLGSNGKSALLRWLEMVFGPQYNKAMDPAYLTHTCDPNKPQSGLMEHRGVRISSISEADPSAQKFLAILNEFLKRWSGGDAMPMREMYGKTGQFKLSGIPLLVVNKYPKFSNPEDEALLRRLAFVPFEARFVNEAELANPDAYVYVKDVDIFKTFERLVPAFSLCMVQWGRELRANGFKLTRPFDTLVKILDYIEEAKASEPNPVLYGQKEAARAWLLRTFEPSAPNADCPDTGDTCPKEYKRGKPANALHVCPCVWKADRVYEEYRRQQAAAAAAAAAEAEPQALELEALGDPAAVVQDAAAAEAAKAAAEAAKAAASPHALKLEDFESVLRKVFEAHKHLKNRHLNANSKEAYFIKLKSGGYEGVVGV